MQCTPFLNVWKYANFDHFWLSWIINGNPFNGNPDFHGKAGAAAPHDLALDRLWVSLCDHHLESLLQNNTNLIIWQYIEMYKELYWNTFLVLFYM